MSMTAEHDLALFEDPAELAERVRSTDSDTSWRAASGISKRDNESLKDTIFRLLANHGPLTDDALFARYAAEGGTRTAQRVRTARVEMTRTRDLRTQKPLTPRVGLADGLGMSEHGGESQLWQAIR